MKVILQETRVSLPKFNEDFPLTLPKAELSHQVQEIFNFLQNAPELQITLKKEIQEKILSIFTEYGRALFQAIIPPTYHTSLQNTDNEERQLALYIYSIGLLKIPWELMHNGKSWHLLDGGIQRIYRGKAVMRRAESDKKWHFLSAPMPSSEQQSTSYEFYHNPSEWFHKKKRHFFYQTSWNINLQATEEDTKTSLKNIPRYLYLEGFHNIESLYFSDEYNKVKTIKIEELNFPTAIEMGLELLIINLKQAFQLPERNHSVLVHQLFQFGLPHLIEITGSLHQRAMAIYMSHLILEIANQKKISDAHFIALKRIAASNSWDWIWFKLWENDHAINLQHSLAEEKSNDKKKENELFFAYQSYWDLRQCYSDTINLKKLQEEILHLGNEEFLLIQDSQFQNAESFINQFIMKYYRDFSIFQITWKNNENLKAQDSFQETPADLKKFTQNIQSYLLNKDQESLFDIQFPANDKKKIIFIFLNFSQDNLQTQIKNYKEKFLAIKQKQNLSNYSLIFISHQVQNTKNTFPLFAPKLPDIIKFFNTEEQNSLKKKFTNILFTVNIPLSYRLLKIIFLLQIKNFSKELKTPEELWNLVVGDFLKKLYFPKNTIFKLCFFLPTPLPIDFLQALLPQQKILATIEILFSYHLIEKNITHSSVRLESGMRYLLEKKNFFSATEKKEIQKLLLDFFLQKENIYQKFFHLYFKNHFCFKHFVKEKRYSLLHLYKKFEDWQNKKIFYYKLFCELANLPEKESLYWLGNFYKDVLENEFSEQCLKDMQVFSDFLEEKGEWKIFFFVQVTICWFFLQKKNFQKVRNYLSPLIEFAKNGLFFSEEILEIALLLKEIEDNYTLVSLLKYFSNHLMLERVEEFSDAFIIACYQILLENKREAFLHKLYIGLQTSKDLKINRYKKAYKEYIHCCYITQDFKKIFFFLTQLKKEIRKNKNYFHYQDIISDIFQTFHLLKKDGNIKIDKALLLLLEEYYSFAEKNKDQKITFYADILGRLYYAIGDEKKSKTYLEEYYQKPVKNDK